ncbi:MAG: hypothetical protein R2861_10835 [Desulfobacterales bacterium]
MCGVQKRGKSRQFPHLLQAAIKNAIHIKELNPDTQVFVLYRDIRTTKP